MGANTFSNRGTGPVAGDAFNALVQTARYEYGHNPYSGTIATKRGYVILTPATGLTPEAYVKVLMAYDAGAPLPGDIQPGDRAKFFKDHAVFDDKWGPAACLKLTDGSWLFFGWAPS